MREVDFLDKGFGLFEVNSHGWLGLGLAVLPGKLTEYEYGDRASSRADMDGKATCFVPVSFS